MLKTTPFDVSRHHIHLDFLLADRDGTKHTLHGILDTGAPRTEFSDEALSYLGFLRGVRQDLQLSSGVQTQKYDR